MLAVAFEGVGGHGDDPRPGGVGILGAEAAGAFEAVHDGHLDVEQEGVETFARDGVERLGAVEGEGGRVAELLKEKRGHALVHGVVLDEENAQRVVTGERGVEGGLLGDGRRRRDRGGDERKIDEELRAPAGGGFDADVAAEDGDEAMGDGESEAGAAVFAGGGGVDLAEGLEEPVLAFERDADAGVAHREAKPLGLVGRGGGETGRADENLAVLGEFDGVGDEIDEDLANAEGVADEERRDVVGDLLMDAEGVGGGRGDGDVDGFADTAAKVEGRAFEFDAPLFDFGEVEDLVDDGQEGVAAGADGVGELALGGVERRGLEEFDHADDRVERRANFVAHVGQKLGFGLGGGLGGAEGDLEVGLGLGELLGAAGDAGFESGEEGVVFDADLPLAAKGTRELLHLDGVEGFFEDEEAVAFGEASGDVSQGVVGVGGAEDDLDVGIDLADAAGGFDAVDAGGHADVEEGDGEGAAGGAGRGRGGDGGLALEDALELEGGAGLDGRGDGRGEVGEFGEGRPGGGGGGENLAVVLVDRRQVVGDEDAAMFRRHVRCREDGGEVRG